MKRPLGALALACLVSPLAAQLRHPFALDSFTSSDGTLIESADALDQIGTSADRIGDVNGDGIPDFAVGSPGGKGPANEFARAGELHVFYGRAGGLGESLTAPGMPPARGFTIYGLPVPFATFGAKFDAGDFNGDGLADIVVGESTADNPGIGSEAYDGACYVFFGKPGGLASQSADSLYLANGNDGSRGFVVFGRDAEGRLGSGVVVDDFNGDGLADIVAGAPFADSVGGARVNSGELYMVFGTPLGFGPGLDLNGLNGANGCVFAGPPTGDFVGGLVTRAGDVNGDGFNDLLIVNGGGDGPGGTRNFSGDVYLVFGRPVWPQTFDLDSLYPENGGNGSQGTVIYGVDNSSMLRAATAGDVNGDGFSDLLLGNPNSMAGPYTNVGRAWLIFGVPGGLGTTRDLANPLDYAANIEGLDLEDQFGRAFGGEFDANGDGIHDFAVSAPSADIQTGAFTFDFNAGEVSLVYGDTGPLPPGAAIAGLNGENGVQFRGTDTSEGIGALAIAGVGDVNRDGVTDFVMSSQFNRVFLVHGKRPSSVLSASSSAFAIAGDGPGGETVPPIDFGDTLRLVIDFSDDDLGAAEGGEPSEVVADIAFSNAALSGLGPLSNVASSYWEFATDRTGWDSAEATVAWTEDEIALLAGTPQDWALFAAPEASGPWSELPTAIDEEAQTATATTTTDGFLALVSKAPPAVLPDLFVIR